ncbi:MAG TPA: NAD-dependent epimerase/dehydratase family protein [Candidatus Dormibacteraeota bacterium]|jgi:2'-hydroxyisoflavone reductase
MSANILIIGGTGFIGPHVTRAALAAGHQVTHFHRGRTAAPPDQQQVETILGDRLVSEDLRRLAERQWDVVIDTSCYFPRAARLTVEALGGRVGTYLFVSTVSVYAPTATAYVSESAPLAELADETTETVDGETYGGLKVLSEVEVMTGLPERTLIVRPGLIAGPGDPTDRFTYWCRRLAGAGEVLAPGPPDHEVQYIDVRDLAQFMVDLAAAGARGVYNATGPAAPVTMETLLDTCRSTGVGTATTVWIDPEFLLTQGVAPWSELPLWVPASVGSITASNRTAVSAGLHHRPLEQTVADTLAWACDRPAPGQDGPPGLAPARERELLERWRSRESA